MTDFSSLYKQYAPEVYRFALYLCGEPAEAEDIASETFVRVWASTRPIEMSTVKGYLFTIARNLFLHRLRSRSRSVELDTDLRDQRPDPQVQAETRAEFRNVMAGLQRLPEADRSALIMRAFHNLPYDEIARALQISVASAKVKVHRARLVLSRLRTAQDV